jgi:hypothetical protein
MTIVLPTLEPDCDRSHSWLNYPIDRMGSYNAYDCLATAIARRELPALLAQSRNAEYFAWWFANVVPAALNIQRRGFGHLDRGRQAAYKRKVNLELHELERKLLEKTRRFDAMREAAETWRQEHERADLEFNRRRNGEKKNPLPEHLVPVTKGRIRQKGYESRLRKIDEARERFLNSSDMKAEFLFDELGLKPAPRARKRPERSVGQHALMHVYRHLRVKDEQYKWVIEDLFHRSRLNTIRTRYLDPPTGPEDRLYPHVRVYAAETLRWAWSEPALHQWVQEIRHLVVPRRGHVFIGADWSALEARISALFCREEKDIAAFSDPARDVHIETALELFGLHRSVTPAEIEILRAEHRKGTKYHAAYAVICPGWAALPTETRTLMRGVAKGYRYETLYGGSGAGNQAKLHCICPRTQCVETAPSEMNMAPEERKNLSRRWAVSRPSTVRWQQELLDSVIRNGKRWTSPFGYTRQFFGPARELRTSILNCPMQTTAGELLNRVVVELDRLGAPTVFQHHDQPVLEVEDHPAVISEFSSMLQEIMERPIPELGGARFPVDLHVGRDWSELK